MNEIDLKARIKTARQLSFSKSLNLTFELADFGRKLKWAALKDRYAQATKKQLLEKFQNQVDGRQNEKASPEFRAFILKSLKNDKRNK